VTARPVYPIGALKAVLAGHGLHPPFRGPARGACGEMGIESPPRVFLVMSAGSDSWCGKRREQPDGVHPCAFRPRTVCSPP